MSQLSYPTYTRLTDALERELMQAAIANRGNVSVTAVAKQIYAGLRYSVGALVNYVSALSDTLNEARTKDARTQCNS